MKRRTKLYLLAALGAVALVTGGGAWLWAEGGLNQARGLAKYGLWPDARRALSRYVWLHPHDPQSHLLYAEALVKDEELLADEAVPQALAHLRAIPDTVPEGAQARMREGRLELFLLYHPTRAEGLFRRAMELDPDMPEAYYLLWKAKDLTGRSHLAEPEFWKVYEASVVEKRAVWLGEWYMSQFWPASANLVLDRLMRLVPAKTSGPAQGEAFRFIGFRDAEPESPLGYAALARWMELHGDTPFALQVLDQAAAKVPNAEDDPFYLATLIGILIERAELERADRCFQRWPEPREGYEYWVTQGRVLQEVRGQYAEAIQAYDRALAGWPGAIDWRTINRKANCLARLRDQAGAARQREKAKAIVNLMEDEIHRRLRDAVGCLNDPERARELVDFYQKINRPREAAAWSDHVARLQSQPTGQRALDP